MVAPFLGGIMGYLEEKVKVPYKLYAHIDDEKAPELLEEHLNLVMTYMKWLINEKGLEPIFKNFHEQLGEIPNFRELVAATFYFHDMGKVNRNFQVKKMKNLAWGKEAFDDTKHALLSALLYIEEYFPKGKAWGLKGKQIGAFCMVVMLNAYVISRHHSPLNEFETFEQSLVALLGRLKEDKALLQTLKTETINIEETTLHTLFRMGNKYLQETYGEWKGSVPYIYVRLLYSLLVACDFYATSEYLKGEKISDIGLIKEKATWQRAYEQTAIYKAIQSYAQREETKGEINTINDMRSQLFLEANAQLEQKIAENIYYLEAPTGSGKTNTSISLVLKLLEQVPDLKKVFYVFPFNTLGEQTYETLTNLFQSAPDLKAQLAVFNSVTPLKEKIKAREGGSLENEELENKSLENKGLDYERMVLDAQFLHEPFIITSHVKLFSLLFETEREQVGGLYQIANSIIVLDEIQSYKNTLWTEIIGFLSAYAQLLNCKIIIMSATLPALGELLDQEPITRLLTNSQVYFKHPLFKNRVSLDFSLLEEEMDLEVLLETIIQVANQHPKILVEFIKKKSANDFYKLLLERKEEIPQEVRLLTGDDSKWERESCIQEVKKSRAILLVATQLIEAGVDIDMDCGFKNISLLDAEEQFLGRINRSCLRQGKAYFFYLDEAAPIYKNDYRKQKQFTLQNKVNQELLLQKDFKTYYNQILMQIKNHNMKNNEQSLSYFLEWQLGKLSFVNIARHMRLIDEEYYPVTVFLGCTMQIAIDGEDKEIDGRALWEYYKNLIQDKDLPYAERKVKLLQCQEQVAGFTWKVKQCTVSYNDRIGDLYYIEDGEQYFTNGKFDREKLSSSSFEMI